MKEFTDELMGHVQWGDNRQVLVFLRTYADRRFVRLRVFNRHKAKGCYYPSPRSFHVALESACELGQIIARAAQGRESNPPPEWWAEFQEQYERKGKLKPGKWKRQAMAANDLGVGG